MGFIFYGIFPIDFMNAFRQFIKLFNHTFTIGESIYFTPKSILRTLKGLQAGGLTGCAWEEGE